MKRKQFKRNVQASRQRRGITYMVESNNRVYKRRELLKNAAGGLVVGLFIVATLFLGYGVY